IQQLKTKEQGFRSEIDNLKLENQNLKEKYNHDLIKIQQELNTSKTKTQQLEGDEIPRYNPDVLKGVYHQLEK
ncbi:MAG: hypothetical protein ACQBVK_05295, partial [Candidatus Phytoplasma sp. TWB_XP]